MFRCTELDNSEKVIVNMLDLDKDFDTVKDQILLNKRETYEIRGSVLDLMGIYMIKRISNVWKLNNL